MSHILSNEAAKRQAVLRAIDACEANQYLGEYEHTGTDWCRFTAASDPNIWINIFAEECVLYMCGSKHVFDLGSIDIALDALARVVNALYGE